MIPGIVAGYGGSVAPVTVTLNPADKSSTITLSNGDLTGLKASGGLGHVLVRATLGVSAGKWYWEVIQDTAMTNSREIAAITKSTVSTASQPGGSADGYGYNGINGQVFHSGAGSTFGATFTTGDIIGIAIDATAGKIWFAKNNVWQGGGDPATGANPAANIAAATWFPTIGYFDQTGQATARFAAADQSYSPPAGFSAFS